MKIVIDGRMLDWTGIGRYTRELLNHLQTLDPVNDYQVLLAKSGFESWQPSADNFSKVIADFPAYSLAEQTRLHGLLKKLRSDLVHFTHFTVPLAYSGCSVVTVHDLTMTKYSTRRGDSALARLKYRGKQTGMNVAIRRALSQANQIITPSQFVRDQISDDYKVSPTKITVTYEAAESQWPSPMPYSALSAQKFVLYVGNAYPFKNLGRLTEAFAGLDVADCKLVLVGKTDHFYSQLEKSVRAAGLQNIVFTGFVPDDQLAWLYRNATAFIFPSLSEGFGLPGLEAMAHGLPVIASNTSCLPEVYGEAAHYFDPNDTADMAAKISEVIHNEELRNKLSGAGLQRVKEFSWKKLAEQTLEVYRKALG